MVPITIYIKKHAAINCGFLKDGIINSFLQVAFLDTVFIWIWISFQFSVEANFLDFSNRRNLMSGFPACINYYTGTLTAVKLHGYKTAWYFWKISGAVSPTVTQAAGQPNNCYKSLVLDFSIKIKCRNSRSTVHTQKWRGKGKRKETTN